MVIYVLVPLFVALLGRPFIRTCLLSIFFCPVDVLTTSFVHFLHYLVLKKLALFFFTHLLMFCFSFQVIGNAKAGDVIGEIGALCYRPQPYTVRSSKLSQLLRVDRNTFLNIVQGNPVDGQIVIDNLYQVYFNTYMFQNAPLLNRRLIIFC